MRALLIVNPHATSTTERRRDLLAHALAGEVPYRDFASAYGPLFAPLPPEDEAGMQVPLTELSGLTPELLAILNAAGYSTLADVIDLEREDIEKIPGMTPERAEQFMGFLAELTTEDGGEDASS